MTISTARQRRAERKRLEKILPGARALCSKRDQMLVGNRQIFELPIPERMKLSSRKLETWMRLVTPTVKQALSDAATDLRNANHAAPSLLAPARPDPLTTNELVNELRPVSRLRPQIQSNPKFFFSFSSCIAFGSRQLRDCRSRGSVSGVGPSRGGDEAATPTPHLISLPWSARRVESH